ncbi:MAG: transposase family protein, partial [Myxococcales bacterium]|nr:transposase family protein [Myxococcales bacterium]
MGLVLRDLGIEPIRALSPQAKGRVERLFATLQDRLIAELALAGKTTIEDANPWLADSFVNDFNRR